MTSPPTKKISYQNLGYFDQIKLINPIKIARLEVDEGGQEDSEMGYGAEEEESSEDEFKLALRPMGLNSGCSPEADDEAGSPAGQAIRPYAPEPTAFELAESDGDGSDDFVLHPQLII